MKAIILAAGMARRFGQYRNGRPKCLLELGGKSLLVWQTELLRKAGIRDIVVVRGYMENSIVVDGARYYRNAQYASTNMVYSLFCAEEELCGDVLISYADIVYSRHTLDAMLRGEECDIGVAVDLSWKHYYSERYGDPYMEAESLVFDQDYALRDIGRSKPEPRDVKGQYIGLTRLNARGCTAIRRLYSKWRKIGKTSPVIRGRTCENMFMTDLLEGLIEEGTAVTAIPIRGGWLEFDSPVDYEKVIAWCSEGRLGEFCRLDTDPPGYEG